MFRPVHLAFALVLVLTAGILAGAGQFQARSQGPARDTPAQQKDGLPAPTGRITGRVLAADNGRPVKRARAFIAAPELPEGRAALTDDSGVFDFAGLPRGRYTLTVSKTGFIGLSYGQRRPLQAGTPLQLGDGQQLKGIEFRLPRGGVIAGRVWDEDGEPMPGAMVRVMRYQYAQGNRQLVPAGLAQTDDKGQYRVWGLSPGDYYVSAVARSFNFGGRGGPGIGGPDGPGGRGGQFAVAIGGALAAVGVGNPGFFGGQDDPGQVGYAPTYYPGVPSVNQARPVAVGLGAEALDIDFNLQLVRTSRVSGRVTSSDGSATTAGNVNLTPDGQTGRGPQFGTNYGSRIQRDGTFAIASVPPGRYMLRVRGDDAEVPQFAAQPLAVDGGDLSDLTVTLALGATISGTVASQATRSPLVPDLSQVRIAAPSTDLAPLGPNATAGVDKDGKFTLDGVSAGLHFIRSQGPLRGWMLKSVIVDGRDIIDTPLEVRSSQKISGVSLLFTDNLAEINGTVTNGQGMPVTEYTVLAFPADPSLWRPGARQIMTARPDQNGKFQIRGLPPGDYFLATVDPAEQGEWFEPAFLDEHRTGAAHVALGEGDVKTQDFKVARQ